MTWDFILRICIAAALGGLIGLDREYRAKDAGFRTHFLVALGSALFMIVSQFGFEQVRTWPGMGLDPSRVASQVVSGIGFIGAGTIIFQRHVLKGLTTAAGIWCTAAIGLTCGAGLYVLATVSTVLALISLEAFNFVLRRFGSRTLTLRMRAPSKDNARQVMEMLEKEHIRMTSCSMERNETPTGHNYTVNMELRMRRDFHMTRLLQLLSDFDGVSFDNIE